MAFYGDATDVVCLDIRTGRRAVVSPEIAAVLCLLGRWVTVRKLAAGYPDLGGEAGIQTLLDALVIGGFVERTVTQGPGTVSAPWKTEAAIFHFGTRDPQYPRNPFAYVRRLRAKGLKTPPPSPIKAIAGPRLWLPPPGALDGLGDALLARRTWRRFAARPLPREDLATLLQFTWGVQRWATIPHGRLVLKTSPSGGSRHPIEAYVIALNVKGLRRGVYHYAAADHQLVDLRRSVSRALVSRLLANQYFFGEAGALVVMSAVFARSMWKYEHSRVYRAILAEAGHLGQTFCLVATSLGLAPFCTMAFSDSPLDDLLRIDGTTEASIYVVGVGTRPPGRVTYPGKARRKR